MVPQDRVFGLRPADVVSVGWTSTVYGGTRCPIDAEPDKEMLVWQK
jgi:hypothetical protein